MILLAFLVVLTESLITVPASHWRAIDFTAPQNSSTAHVSFTLEKGGAVQAIVLDRQQAERFQRGRSNRPLYQSGFSTSDQFRVLLPDAGDYVLILDNRLEGRFPAEVALRLELSHPGDSRVSFVPHGRRHATIALSLLFFGAVVVFSAVKFLRN